MKQEKVIDESIDESISHPSPINYPKDLKMWNKNVPVHRFMTIINPSDFPFKDIYEGLGIESSTLLPSFGITDSAEIKERQSIMQFMSANRSIESWISNCPINFDLPYSENEFLRYFNPNKDHTPFWTKIRHFVDMMGTAETLPNRVQKLVDFLRENLDLEENEKVMSKFMSEGILNTAVIEGLMKFKINFGTVWPEPKPKKGLKRGLKLPDHFLAPEGLELIDSCVHGYRRYSFDASEAALHTDPSWTESKNNPLNIIKINKVVHAVNEQRNKQEIAKAYKELTIDKASEGLLEDLENGILEKLEFDWQNFKWNKNDKKGTEVFIKVYFSYCQDGLQIKIYGMDNEAALEKPEFQFDSNEGYSKEKVALIQQYMKRYKDEAEIYQKLIWNAKKMVQVEQQAPGLFDKTFEIPSPNTDLEHRWFALMNLYTDPKVNEIYQEALNFRRFVREHLSTLQSVAGLSQQIRAKATKLGKKICFPEIIEDGEDVHIVEFDELYPIQLLKQLEQNGEKPVAIKDMVPINGRIIGLTGSHGGGKTVAALSVCVNVFLAQSGLPIIGKNFRLNPKEVLGLVFIDKAKGSTCEGLIRKTMNIIEGIKGVDGRKVVVVLDELGSATQERDGLDFGKLVLTGLFKQKVSTLFSTQIQNLALYAKDELKAICYKLDRKHSMSEGISDGGMKALCSEMGLTQLLEASA